MKEKPVTVERSEIMRQIRRQNTGPELTVRRLLWQIGYRFRLNLKELPGTPDIVFTRKRKVIFVHGCFWHGHTDCSLSRIPKTRTEFWQTKIDRNRNRDGQVIERLKEEGWLTLVVWQCEIRDRNLLVKRLIEFLGSPRHNKST